MEFVSVRELKANTAEVWEKLAKEHEIVVTLSGKPVALMAGITGNNLEAILAALRKARGELAIRKLREQAKTKGLAQLTEAEINNEIKKTRRERHR